MVRPDGDGYPVDRWQRIFFESRGKTISRGASEIQRTIVAERVLGLPKEPRPAPPATAAAVPLTQPAPAPSTVTAPEAIRIVA